MTLDLFYITFISVFIIDISGVIDYIKKQIVKILFKIDNPDPSYVKLPFITCSLCTVWWAGIIYILINNEFTFKNIALVAAFSLSTSVIYNVTQLLLDLINTLISKIYKLIQ